MEPTLLVRGHVIDVGDGAQMPLQRRRHRARHHFRARARESCADTKIAGASILGSGATGRSVKATMPHKRDPERQQDRRDRSGDERRRDVHAGLVRQLGAARLILAGHGRTRLARRSNAR